MTIHYKGEQCCSERSQGILGGLQTVAEMVLCDRNHPLLRKARLPLPKMEVLLKQIFRRGIGDYNLPLLSKFYDLWVEIRNNILMRLLKKVKRLLTLLFHQFRQLPRIPLDGLAILHELSKTHGLQC